MAIPVYLIRQIQIDFRRKIILGISLCLSIIMISGFVISMSTFLFRSNNPVEFWQFIEACVVVILLSLTTIRLLFVMRAGSRDKVAAHSNRRTLWRRTGHWGEEHAGSEGPQTLPSIPRATWTGMRPFINGGDSEIKKETSDEDKNAGSLQDMTNDCKIWGSKSEPVYI